VRPVTGDEKVGACLYGCGENRRVFGGQKVVCPGKTGRSTFGNYPAPTQEVFELCQSTRIFAFDVAPRLFGSETRGQQDAVTRFSQSEEGLCAPFGRDGRSKDDISVEE